MKEIEYKLKGKLKDKPKDKPKGKPEYEPSLFKGTVTVGIPSASERFALVKDFQIGVNDKGEMDVTASEGVDVILKMEVVVKKYVSKIDLEHKCGEKFKKLEELDVYAEYQDVIVEVANLILGGLKLGEA